jgi:hypothetical protein
MTIAQKSLEAKAALSRDVALLHSRGTACRALSRDGNCHATNLDLLTVIPPALRNEGSEARDLLSL